MKSNLNPEDENLLTLIAQYLEFNSQQMQLLTNWLKANEKSFKNNLIDSAELKQQYHISDSTIYRLRKKGKLSFTKLGNKYLYSRSAIENLMEQEP